MGGEKKVLWGLYRQSREVERLYYPASTTKEEVEYHAQEVIGYPPDTKAVLIEDVSPKKGA